MISRHASPLDRNANLNGMKYCTSCIYSRLHEVRATHFLHETAVTLVILTISKQHNQHFIIYHVLDLNFFTTTRNTGFKPNIFGQNLSHVMNIFKTQRNVQLNCGQVKTQKQSLRISQKCTKTKKAHKNNLINTTSAL